jgi:opacity protein-like surface antigen
MKLLVAAVAALALAACGSAASTPTPVGTPMTVNQLKFAVMDAVGTPVYCDRDFYPLARAGGEQASAIGEYPQIRADAELYSTVVAHEHLPSGELTDEQKLVLYRAWKLLGALTMTQAGTNYSFSYRVLSKSGTASYLQLTGTVRVDGMVTVSSRTPTGAPNCPICLAAATLISTPNGDVRVTDIKPGMLVWTAGVNGARVAAKVLEVGSTQVPASHRMVHLMLADGRELLASPGHRTGDGRQLGSLASGQALDGSMVTYWELVPYDGDRTYDLLPAGPTGTYWANGILLSSTLSHQGSGNT